MNDTEVDNYRAMALNLIGALWQDYKCVSDPNFGSLAKARIESVRRVLIDHGDAVDSRSRRHELIVDVLERSDFEGTIEMRVQFAHLVFREAMPYVHIPLDVVHAAVSLWPEKKQRVARTEALRELARVLDCDSPSLMVLLRKAKGGLRQRRRKVPGPA